MSHVAVRLDLPIVDASNVYYLNGPFGNFPFTAEQIQLKHALLYFELLKTMRSCIPAKLSTIMTLACSCAYCTRLYFYFSEKIKSRIPVKVYKTSCRFRGPVPIPRAN